MVCRQPWNRISGVGVASGAGIADAPSAFLAAIYDGDTGGRPIPADAPPLFTTVAHHDRIHFRVIERLYRDWSGADRPAELHVFARGGHSFGMTRQGLPSDAWIDLFGAWLADQGFG